MKILTTTQARKHIKQMVDQVKYRGEVFAIGRRNSIDALVINFPDAYNKEFDEITNINALSKSFDFLKHEPDLYSVTDLKKKYV
jgi:PHD/YefM family antitoxin component YafN of YafNO toxin-antitoxin module